MVAATVKKNRSEREDGSNYYITPDYFIFLERLTDNATCFMRSKNIKRYKINQMFDPSVHADVNIL